MTSARLPRRHGDGSAVVRGWVSLYTLGLPGEMRNRRRLEVAGDLADEALDAMRRGERPGPFRRRLVRLILGIPADLSWRLLDASDAARLARVHRTWVPVSRWSLALIATVVFLAGGGLAIVTVPVLMGEARDPGAWLGWGPYGFTIGATAVLVGVHVSIPWPRRGAALMVPGAAIGFLASPWLWGMWMVAILAVIVRGYQVASHQRGGAR